MMLRVVGTGLVLIGALGVICLPRGADTEILLALLAFVVLGTVGMYVILRSADEAENGES